MIVALIFEREGAGAIGAKNPIISSACMDPDYSFLRDRARRQEQGAGFFCFGAGGVPGHAAGDSPAGSSERCLFRRG